MQSVSYTVLPPPSDCHTPSLSPPGLRASGHWRRCRSGPAAPASCDGGALETLRRPRGLREAAAWGAQLPPSFRLGLRSQATSGWRGPDSQGEGRPGQEPRGEQASGAHALRPPLPGSNCENRVCRQVRQAHKGLRDGLRGGPRAQVRPRAVCPWKPCRIGPDWGRCFDSFPSKAPPGRPGPLQPKHR